MKHYLTDKEEVLSSLETSENGLSSEEAAKRLERDGKNKLAEGKKVTILQRIISQLLDPMVLVLIGAAIVSAITEIAMHEPPTDVFIILAVVVLNTILGVVQESKAEKAIDALKEMAAATSKIIRDGKHMTVKSEELVKGDIVILEAGDASIICKCESDEMFNEVFQTFSVIKLGYSILAQNYPQYVELTEGKSE